MTALSDLIKIEEIVSQEVDSGQDGIDPDEKSNEESRQLASLQNRALNQVIDFREKYSKQIFQMTTAYLIVIAIMTGASGYQKIDFYLSEKVMIALLSTTTANVLGLLYIVAKFIFPDHKK